MKNAYEKRYYFYIGNKEFQILGKKDEVEICSKYGSSFCGSTAYLSADNKWEWYEEDIYHNSIMYYIGTQEAEDILKYLNENGTPYDL